MNVHIDIETYSECDLRKCGVYRYAEDQTTEILIAAMNFDGCWDITLDLTLGSGKEEFEDTIRGLIADRDTMFWAHNAAFERIMLKTVFSLDIPADRWRCTQVLGYLMAFSGGLGDMVAALSSDSNVQKDAIGKKLINRFSKPQPKNRKVRRWTRENDPEQWAQFIDYCAQDVVAEMEIHNKLKDYYVPEIEWQLYALDQEINDRGLPIDRPLVEQAIATADTEKAILLNRMKLLTSLNNPGSNAQLFKWLKEHGLKISDMRKDTLASAVEKENPARIQSILELKLQYSKTSVAKWKALDRSICGDDRIHGAFHFGGASRTMRWAGRIFQPQNLPRPTIDDPDSAAELLIAAGHDGATIVHDDVMAVLSSTLRSAVKAPERMIVSDLSSIESRVLGWFTDCRRILNIFATGRDTYKDMATQIFHRPYEEITKKQRTFAKPVVLGGGYGLGTKGLMGYAEGFGLDLTEEEAQSHVNAFRETYHEVPSFWSWIKDAVFRCTKTGVSVENKYFSVEKQGEFLRIKLPSGRYLSYHRPEIIRKEAPWGDMIDNFSFMGMNQYTRKWERLTMHAGGITENICQALARDVLAVWMLRAKNAGLKLFLHVHDEIGVLDSEDRLEEMNELIRNPIPWAPGLPLNADGYTSTRYRK